MASTLTSLLKAASITDHEEVLKAANAVLKSSKNNLDALHTRIVALLNLDRYHDALRAFDDACGCVARGDLNSASVLLKRARDLCEALEDMSDEAKQEEVLPIMVQQAYVFTKLGKIEEAKAIQKMINIADLGAINAAANAKCEAGKAGLKQILPLLEKRPNDVGLILVIIQLYILTNNPSQATTLLEAFFKRLEESQNSADQDVRFAPGLVGLVVSLYRSTGRKGPIKKELGKAASYWRRKENSSPALLRAAGTSLLESSNPEDLEAAGEIFSSLRAKDPNDRAAVAGFVASYATTDLDKAASDLEKLTPVSRLISGVDAASLEDEGVPTLPLASSQVASKKRQADSAEKEKEKPAKTRKISKSKMPKEFVEGKQMDPERWLPLRDRSSYRPKGKKGKKKAADLTQGGVVKEEPESLELAGGAGTVKVEKSVPGKSKNKKKGKK
ncbi:putative Signal recognition particle subunit srp72 [Glarea lozoyensis 74030]|uniref:Signal recognition particle subunit SRP72 n=1 Tax=Glarea lozoyensis (strain ATCC 74030 / MF5533) TaxID=1104152 RepID=H0EWX2_GLAL7|nr:putative Signal recognition particle subunit srp72 [Glarea lozoyensis 74030]